MTLELERLHRSARRQREALKALDARQAARAQENALTARLRLAGLKQRRLVKLRTAATLALAVALTVGVAGIWTLAHWG